MLTPESIAAHSRSVAGIETCIQLPSYRIAFDIGRCPSSAVKHPRVALSHAHMDHISGLFYHANQRALRRVPPPTYVVHPELVAPLQDIFDAYGRLHDKPMDHVLAPLSPGERMALGKKAELEAFATDHTVRSQGYAIHARTRALKPDFQELPGPELGRLHGEGVELYDYAVRPVFAFTGDTRVEVVERVPVVREAALLVIEATYLDDDTPIEKARERGHIHLDEIIARADLFHNDAIVLAHISKRYSPNQILEILDRKLPPQLKSRVTPLLST